MDRAHYNTQIERLETQWPNSYGEERKAILWVAFKDTSNAVFAEAVSECIASHRAAPLLPDLSKAVEIAKTRENSYRGGAGSVWGVVQQAAKQNKSASPEFVKACTKLLREKLDGKITHKQFLEGCDLLDEAARIGSGA